MVRPLDHVTVIQQMNFAERIHQNQQTHPELSQYHAAAVGQQEKLRARRRTPAVRKSEPAKVYLHKESLEQVKRKTGRNSTDLKV